MRIYSYVGSQDIRRSLPQTSHRLHVTNTQVVMEWIKATRQPKEPDGTIVVTFIIDPMQRLWINDRRSEHVLCAGGDDVLSAGEMVFAFHGASLHIVGISNQSTGYCPEPESWRIVNTVLTQLAIPHPDEFTMVCVFRRCDHCHTLNLVKDDWFECAVCQSPLSQTWNLA